MDTNDGASPAGCSASSHDDDAMDAAHTPPQPQSLPLPALHPLLAQLSMTSEPMTLSAGRSHHQGDAGRQNGHANEEDSVSSDSSNSATMVPESGRDHRRRTRREAATVRSKGGSRKPSYVARKEEKEALLLEISKLEREMAHIYNQMGLPGKPAEPQLWPSIDRIQKHRQTMREALHARQLALVSMHSALSLHLNGELYNPLDAYLHLGSDMAERRASLLALRRERIQASHRYVMARFQHVDETKTYDSMERRIDPAGNIHFCWNQIAHFEGVRSVRQVFDALTLCIFFMDMAMSESHQQVMVREDIVSVPKRFSNHRMLTTYANGLVEEVNQACFGDFFEDLDEIKGNACGVLTANSVDVDDLYPYRPHTHLRRDISAVAEVTSFKRKRSAPAATAGMADSNSVGGNETGDEELVAVVKRCAYVTIYQPAFPVSKGVLDELCKDMTEWGYVMTKSVNAILYGQKL